MNPVRTGMVDVPCGYKWSSHNIYLGHQQHGLLSNKYVLALFGPVRPLAVHNYRLFMDESESSPTMKKLREGGTDKRAVGNDKWLENLLSEEYTPPCKKTLDDIVAAACHLHGIEEFCLAAPRGSHRYSEIRARIAIYEKPI